MDGHKMIIKTRKRKKYGRKYHESSSYLTKININILSKVSFISVLLFILFKAFNNENIECKIFEELDKVKPFIQPFTLDNIKEDFEYLVNKYKYLIKRENNIKDDCPIWMMWYQGIRQAPPLVLACIQSVIKNREKHPVIIISKYNIEKYIKLPSYIIEKFHNKTFSITHFSDIVRLALLFKYGGYWIDSTYFINTPLTKVKTSFHTLQLKECFTNKHPFVKCIWGVNFMAVTKNSFIATYSYHAILFYWKKYNSLINYFLIDYIIHIAYYNVPEFKKIFEIIPIVNCNTFILFKNLNSKYNPSDICLYNKLSKNGQKKYKGNEITNYDYIIENNKFDFNNTNNYILNI